MDVSEKARLEKLLGMLGSSFDGERANAARMIANMADKKKLTITELIYGSSSSSSRHRTDPRPQPNPAHPGPFGGKSNARTMLHALASIAANSEELEFVLTEWECQFANDVSSRYAYDYELTEKQIVIVERILRKVEVSGYSSAPG